MQVLLTEHLIATCTSEDSKQSWGNFMCEGNVFIYVYTLHVMCFRPAYATPKVLERAGLKMSDISVFEFHEAFAVS